MKLYKVFLRGMQSSFPITYGVSYVVADNPDAAFSMVKKYLDKKDIGFVRDREMGSIELLAEEKDYPNCGNILFIQKEEEGG